MIEDAVDKGDQERAGTERSDARGAGVALVRQETVVLLVDLVESVRLMREHEASTVRRWADFARIVTTEILPRRRGVLVKSLGDGLLVVSRRCLTPSMPPPRCTGHLTRRTPASRKTSIFIFAPASTPRWRGAMASTFTGQA